MEQRTLNLDGTMVYVYADGSVEYLCVRGRARFLNKTFGSTNGEGYLQVRINNKHYKVHRLIAMAFHSNPNNLPEVDHIDRNKQNNKPENLRWVTSKENNDNKDYVDRSLEKYGVRECDDPKAYDKQRNKHRLKMIKPDGSCTKTGALSLEEYDLLKPLSQKERYLKYQEIKGRLNE